MLIRSGMLALAAVFLAACGPAPGQEFRSLGCPIIGGQEDTNPDHDAVVLVYDAGQGYMCTGTLVSPRVVLTAAHCLTGTDMRIGFGNQATSVEWRDVHERHPHPYYDAGNLVNDIAVLIFGGSPPPGVTPIPHLPAALQITNSDLGQSLEWVGFGATNGDGDGAGTKRTMTNTLAWICTSAWCGWDNPGRTNTICQDQSPTGICSGDSGGPAFIVRNGREYVAGVTSYSGEDCLYFGCSTKVDEFESFLDDYLGASLGEACNDNFDCALGFCIDGVCCESACEHRCMACNTPGNAGLCRLVSDGTACPDGNVCNGQEVCMGGECQPGTPLECGPPVMCTNTGCDPQFGCVFEPLPDGAACPDSSLCNGTEICMGGICQPGTALDCDDRNPCTRNWCGPQDGCMHENLPDGYPCTDLGDRMCLQGECVEVPGQESGGCNCGPSPGASAGFPRMFALLWLAVLVVFLRKR